MSQKSFISILVIVFSFTIVLATPSEDPIKCSNAQNTTCTITNSYGMFPDRTICQTSQALYPTSEQELVSMVASSSWEKEPKSKLQPVIHTAYQNWYVLKIQMVY